MYALERWRRDNHLTYNELAEMLGVTRQYAHIICKKGLPGARIVQEIITLTGVPCEELIPYVGEDRRGSLKDEPDLEI